MDKTTILYDLNDKTQSEKNRIIRNLFGYQDKSCHGKYHYKRPGLLSNIHFDRKTKTALIIHSSEKKRVLKMFKKLAVNAIAIKEAP